ncbi:glutamine amidotransferase [Corynebacterium canis]|uniref:Lipid II isoglutaminyl synthase (glutamine-hydrolyzing) subunit GatD n=1 Tax=Corynebacterium canis TaxID=679663 RepID=A0A5C5UDD7_9CORY|nr:glutamine amidotransferase [Corynebacterium canis]TWT24164.1 glutamine amidotransferase [Corynebacterium canis]WJY73975.1 cobyric acid synthase [Corynebacterium canis]
MSTLKIGLVLPDVLGTYGDDGNALVLRQRARMRGIDAEIVPARLGADVPGSLDIYCIGGGEDTAQILASSHLRSPAGAGLRTAAEQGTPVLAICAGLQVLGESFRAGGRVVDGLGLIDATTGSLAQRTIGEVQTTPSGLPGLTAPLTGFANHMGATILGPDARPLGRVTRGVGNLDAHTVAENPEAAGQERAEGAVQGSVIATYMHGPVLARNPELADLLLAKAMGIGIEELEPLDIPVVEQLRKERLA